MKRLRTKLVVSFAGVTLLTVLITSLPQLNAIVRDNQDLPVAERSGLSAGQVGRALLRPRGLPAGWAGGRVNVLEGLRDQARGAAPALDAAAGPAGVAATGVVGTGAVATAASDGPWVSLRDVGGYLRNSIEQRAATLVGSAAVALALAVGLGLLLARVIAKPIQRVAVAADRVAAGDLAARVPVSAARARDGDETARLAESFNSMASSLERLERQRRDMVADVAHELRTPLTVLRGRLEALEDGVVPFTLAEVADMHAQVLVLTRLVEDLRVLSLADAGALKLDLRQLDLAELVTSAVAAHQVRAADKGVSLVSARGAPVPAELDGERMLQVLNNLIDNALRYTPVGGHVTLSTSLEAGSAVLEVADTGAGIPADVAERVFERFYRADGSRTRDGGGSGLGLAIVKAIVELHGGRVSARVGQAGGTVVRIELPAGTRS